MCLTVALGIVFAYRFRKVEDYVEVQICITYSFPYANHVLFWKEKHKTIITNSVGFITKKSLTLLLF